MQSFEPVSPSAPEASSFRFLPPLHAFFAVVLCAIAVCCLGGCASTASTKIPPERRVPQSLDGIGPGDTLKITFMGALEQSQTVKVPPDGRLSLPYIKGDVNAIDKSAGTLQKWLTENCSDLTNKTVIVTLQESAKRVYVTGALKGMVLLEHPMTVAQVVAAAGGAPEETLSKPVTLRCVEDGKAISYSIYLNDPNPVYVRPGDEIRVVPSEF